MKQKPQHEHGGKGIGRRDRADKCEHLLRNRHMGQRQGKHHHIRHQRRTCHKPLGKMPHIDAIFAARNIFRHKGVGAARAHHAVSHVEDTGRHAPDGRKKALNKGKAEASDIVGRQGQHIQRLPALSIPAGQKCAEAHHKHVHRYTQNRNHHKGGLY